MSRFMRNIAVAGKHMALRVAEDVRQAGYKRMIDAIDKACLLAVINKVQAALEGGKVLSPELVAAISSVTITYVSV
jgi:hypothetical protein